MISKFLPHIGSPFVPELVKELMQGNGSIQKFVQWTPTMESIQAYADTRNFSPNKRTTLVDALTRQYAAINGSKQVVLDNIASLRDIHTFTITTGQQVHAFLGPVFFVTKILDCIAIAQQATAQAIDKKFVPVFWMAAEDHDFAEIDTVSVYNTPFTWTTDGTG